jgi:hypothetical protein
MNFGTSMCVGQAPMHGASKQYKHRSASVTAAVFSNGGCSSANRTATSADPPAFEKKLVASLMGTSTSPFLIQACTKTSSLDEG